MRSSTMGAQVVPSAVLFGAEEITRWVPHRPPMLLLDGIVAFEPEVRCTSIRRARTDEHFVAGHYPGNAIVPGIYLIENIAQTACFLAQRSAGTAAATPVLARVERCSFAAPVRPPADVLTEVEVVRRLDTLSIYAGRCRVAGRTVCRAEIVVGRHDERSEA